MTCRMGTVCRRGKMGRSCRSLWSKVNKALDPQQSSSLAGREDWVCIA